MVHYLLFLYGFFKYVLKESMSYILASCHRVCGVKFRVVSASRLIQNVMLQLWK